MENVEVRDKLVHDVLCIVETTGYTLRAIDLGLFSMDNPQEESRTIERLTELSKETLEGCNEMVRYLGGIPVMSTLGGTVHSLIFIDAFTRHTEGVWSLNCRAQIGGSQETFLSAATTSRIRETYIRKLPKYTPPKQL